MNHFYPGIAVTSEMYGEQWREAFPGAYHDWPKWQGEQTIAELAERLVVDHDIQDGDQLVGTSFGGMVAAEIGRLRHLNQIVLISSATTNEEINQRLARIHSWVDHTPVAFLERCAEKIPGKWPRMFARTDPDFNRAMIKAIFKWEGLKPGIRCLRIHGKNDPIIPPPRHSDFLVDGGHLITMTHPCACIRIIRNQGVLAHH